MIMTDYDEMIMIMELAAMRDHILSSATVVFHVKDSV